MNIEKNTNIIIYVVFCSPRGVSKTLLLSLKGKQNIIGSCFANWQSKNVFCFNNQQAKVNSPCSILRIYITF